MKTVVIKKIVQLLTLASAATFGSSAFAGATWTFGDDYPYQTSLCSASEAAAGCAPQAGSSAGSPSVKVSAYSTTGSSGKFAAATLTAWDGGLGVEANSSDSGSPQHAMDNNGYTDMILLNFGSARIDLDSIQIGWKQTDADISVFRYVGSATAPTPVGLSVTNLSTGGWELVGNYADLGYGARAVNSTDKSSSWWLISAYNADYGSSKEVTGGSLGTGNDYFKVLSVAGNVVTPPPPPTSVPEPGSLALMGIAMAGFVATRRRKQQAD